MKLRGILIFLCKIVITCSLLFSFIIVINGDYIKLRDRVKNYFSTIKGFKGHDRIAAKAKMTSLNQAMPHSFVHLLKLSDNQEKPDIEYINNCIHYYEMIAEFMPNQPDAYGMLGFLYYHIQDIEKSIYFYKKAIALNSGFFWYHYNLGVIYFENEQFFEAVGYLSEAMQKDISMVLRMIFLSKLHIQMKANIKGIDETILPNFVQGQKNCLRMLVFSLYHLNEFEKMFNIAVNAIKSNFDQEGYFFCYAGLAAYEMKDYKKAIELLNESIRKNSDHPDALNYLGLSLKALGQEKQSKEVLSKASVLLKIKKRDTWFDKRYLHLQLF